MQCFRNFPVAKKFMDKRLGGDIKSFRQKFFLSLCRKLSYGNHFVQCFRFFAVAKKFMDKGGGGAGIKIFRRIIFLSQCREISWGHPVEQCFRNFPVPKKFLDKGGISRLSVEKIFTHCAEKFRRGIFTVSLISGIEKCYG